MPFKSEKQRRWMYANNPEMAKKWEKKEKKMKKEQRVKQLIKKMVREELKNINEVNFEKIKLPSQVNRFLVKFVDAMKSANLNRIKRAAILYKVIDASGMTPQQLMADIQKVKKELQKEEKLNEKAKRDYKAEYKKFQSSTKSKKYRAELNAYNRKKGTYGNGDGKDASHKGGKIVGFEAESKNRGRREKSRLKKEGKLTEDIGTTTYLGGIAQALKKAGIRFKKAKVMKGRGITGRADVGFFITLNKGIILPLEIRKGYVYYEIEDSHKLGKWADTNKVAQSLKKFSKIDDFGQGKLVKKEGTCGYGENGQIGEEPAGPHLIKKKKIKESQQVAKTILQQLGGNKFIAMTGAKNFGSSRNSLQFKIGRNSKSISHVIITLKSSDLYDVEFIRMRGTSRKVVKKLKGVYGDMLPKIFKKYTGMNVRL